MRDFSRLVCVQTAIYFKTCMVDLFGSLMTDFFASCLVDFLSLTDWFPVSNTALYLETSMVDLL